MKRMFPGVGLLFALTVLGQEEKNWIRNGSFEEYGGDGSVTAWSLAAANGKKATDAFDGENAAEFNGSFGQWVIPLPPGDYALRFMLRKGCVNVLGVSVICNEKGGAQIKNAGLKAYVGEGESLLDWRPFEFKVNVPTNAVHASLVFHSHGGLMLIDGVSLTAAKAGAGGELVFQDTFDRKEIGPDWKLESGGWKIVGGALFAPVKMDEAIIKLMKPLGGNLRVEYACWSESPCDLGAMLGTDSAKTGFDGYVFSFGASYNSYNYIGKAPPFSVLTRTLQEGFNSGVQPGRKHTVVASKMDGKLSLFIDGRLELLCDDVFADEVAGKSLGLFTYSRGYFDDVKVYRLPETDRPVKLPERKVEQVKLCDFSKDSDVAGINVSVVKVPTWDYAGTREMEQVTIDDPCLKAGSAEFKMPEVETGIIEFDLFAENLQEITISLLAADKQALGGLVIGKDGFFRADGADGVRRLNDKIEYRRRLLYDDLRFTAGKWHTLRIKYDLKNRMIDNLAIINAYTEVKGGYGGGAINQGDYISLGGRIPLRGGGAATGLAITAARNQTVLVDNVLMFGPVGFKSVNGRSILCSGRDLLNLGFQLRRDPMSLKVQSLRHFTKREYAYRTPALVKYRDGGGKACFQEMAARYNVLMLRSAFLRERVELLGRLAGYRDDPSLRKGLERERSAYGGVEALQERAVQSFADAYWHGADEDRLATATAAVFSEFEKAVAAQEDSLAAVEGAGATPIPAVPVTHAWSLKYDPSIKMWRRNGKEEAFFLTGQHGTNRWVLDKVNLLGFQPALASCGWANGGTVKSNEFIDSEALKRAIQKAETLQKENGVEAYSSFWLQHGTGQVKFPVPKWWLDAHGADPDIFHYMPDGAPGKDKTPIYRGWPTFPFLPLNFWNPDVGEYLERRFMTIGAEMGKRKDVFRNSIFHLGGEACLSLPNGLKLGYAPSAVRKFRKTLADKFGAIDALNRAWGTAYADFPEIKPPRGMGTPSGLQYEFNAFVGREYFEVFINKAIGNLEKGYGEKLPIGHDFQDTFSSFDMPAFFDNVSLVLFHSYQIWDRKIYPKWLMSLSQASKIPWGAMEWGSSQGSKTLFDCEQVRLHGLREISHQLMWGCAAPNLFSNLNDGPSDWQYGMIPTDWRVAHLLLDYNISYYRIAKDRGIRFGRPALTAPLAPPDVAVLEVDSSRRNAPPDQAIYAMCKAFAMEMEAQRVNYGFLFEKFLLDGRQNLEGVQVLFVPNGICMPDRLDKVLEGYVEKGGVIVAFAPPGVFNEIGKSKPGMLGKAFPDVVWTHDNFCRWKADGARKWGEGAASFYAGRIGRGALYVFTVPNDWNGPRASVLRLMRENVTPRITSSQGDFQYCLREKDSVKYLYVLNDSIDAPREGEFSLAGSYGVEDVSLASPAAVPAKREGDRTTFKIRLSMSEMALLKLSPATK